MAKGRSDLPFKKIETYVRKEVNKVKKHCIAKIKKQYKIPSGQARNIVIHAIYEQ